ncbi:hypothetical protein [Puia sp.]|jgi:hypothetical protein|uniref:hypothetical protein n=1 Tax=Puia sp. TaxID=2045100 RepID=UPI002F420C46
MSLNNIALSTLIISEWYSDAALVPPAGSTIPQSAAPQPAAANPSPVTPQPIVEKQSPVPPQPVTEQSSPVPPQPAPPPEPTAYKILGNHRRKVTIIVDSPAAAFLPDDQLGFLSKILEACRMNIGDVAIVNHHTAPVSVTALRQQLQPASILLFGIEPTAIRLPINFPTFKLQPYDQCTYLYAPSLQEMVGNTADAKLLKSKLWVCLKTLFDV